MIEQCKSCKNKEIINGIIGCVYMDADCQNGEKYEAEIITNADRIRAEIATVEGLAEYLIHWLDDWGEFDSPAGRFETYEEALIKTVEWLKQPAEE